MDPGQPEVATDLPLIYYLKKCHRVEKSVNKVYTS